MSWTCLVGVAAELALRRLFLLRRLRRADRVPPLQRELGVDHQARAAVGEEDQAVRPVAVGKRRLELVARGRQPVAHDRFHARLAEGAALLLVGEDVLQLDHLGGEVGDRPLRLVDHRQPLAELGQALVGAARRLAHRLADPVAEAVEPVGQVAHLARDLALMVAKLGEPRGDAVLAGVLKHLHPLRRLAPGEEGDEEEHEEQHGGGAGNQRGAGDGHVADRIGRFQHRASIARFVRRYKTGTNAFSAAVRCGSKGGTDRRRGRRGRPG